MKTKPKTKKEDTPVVSAAFDSNELELPETTFVRDIEDRVFQALVLQCLSHIEGIALLEGNVFDQILGRAGVESVKGIHAEQDSKHQAVNICVEINVCYGVSIPEKAEEIQMKVAEDITRLTGLHVASVHVVFKSVLLADPHEKLIAPSEGKAKPPVLLSGHVDDEYTEEF